MAQINVLKGALVLAVLLAACQAGVRPPNTVGPEGGTLVFDDLGVTLEIAPGALAEPVTVTATKIEGGYEGGLGPAYLLRPAGVAFGVPASLTMPYQRTEYLPRGVEEPVYVVRAAGEGQPFTSMGGVVPRDGQVRVPASGLLLYQVATAVPLEIAREQGYPPGIALSGAHVYWTNFGTKERQLATRRGLVMRAPLVMSNAATIGTPEIFAADQVDPRHLAVGGERVYWTSGGSGGDARDAGILSAPLSGGEPVRVVGARAPSALVVDGGGLYYADSDLQTVNRANLDGTGAMVLAQSGLKPMAMASDGAFVYWVSRGTIGATDGGVARVPVSGGSAVTLASGQAEPVALTLDSEAVYWVNKGDGKVQRTPLAGGEVTTLYTLMRPGTIAVDTAHIYIADVLTQRVLRLSKTGGEGLARSVTGGHVNRMVTDGANLYWVTDGATRYQGTVRVISKDL